MYQVPLRADDLSAATLFDGRIALSIDYRFGSVRKIIKEAKVCKSMLHELAHILRLRYCTNDDYLNTTMEEGQCGEAGENYESTLHCSSLASVFGYLLSKAEFNEDFSIYFLTLDNWKQEKMKSTIPISFPHTIKKSWRKGGWRCFKARPSKAI